MVFPPDAAIAQEGRQFLLQGREVDLYGSFLPGSEIGTADPAADVRLGDEAVFEHILLFYAGAEPHGFEGRKKVLGTPVGEGIALRAIDDSFCGKQAFPKGRGAKV